MAKPATNTTAGPTTQQSMISWMPTGTLPGKGSSSLLWSGLQQQSEHVPSLLFPQSVDTYRRMRSDPRIQAVLNAWMLPIEQTLYQIDPNGSRPEVYRPIADDLGIPIVGETGRGRLRNKGRFRHSQHIHEALLMMAYGFQMFETVGEYRDDRPGGGEQLWHMSKLAPIPSHTLAPLGVDNHGNLLGVKQRLGIDPNQFIPESVLVPFVWGMEDASWYGRSILRGAYQPWLIKDTVVRVVTEMHERNGMGLPTVTLPPGAGDPEQAMADALGAGIRAGAFSHVTLPDGMSFSLEGVKGTLPDGKGFLDWLNREISSATLTGFLDMPGAKNGSLALAAEIIDFFQMSQQAAQTNYLDTMNDYVVERHVDINWGEDEPAPRIIAKAASNPAEALTPLYEAITHGAVTVTPDIEAYVRERVGADPSVAGSSETTPVSARARRTRVTAAAGDTVDPRLPDRPLRRQETAKEQQSQINLRALDDHWRSALAALLLAWGPIRANLIDDAIAQVAATGDASLLALIRPDMLGADVIEEAMREAWQTGAEIAAGEIEAQGNTAPKIPSIDKMTVPPVAGIEAVTHAEAISRMAIADATGAANKIGQSASDAALHRAGGTLTADERAQQVKRLLGKLKGQDEQTRLGGSLSYATHMGRIAIFQNAPDGSTYLADELLDDNTCTECIAIDQTEFATLDDALSAYPSQGYIDCSGGDRCRGQLAILTPSSYDTSGEG